VNQSKIMVLADWSQWESHPGWVPKGESSPKGKSQGFFGTEFTPDDISLIT